MTCTFNLNKVDHTFTLLVDRDSSAIRWLFVRLAGAPASGTKSRPTVEESRTTLLCENKFTLTRFLLTSVFLSEGISSSAFGFGNIFCCEGFIGVFSVNSKAFF